MSTTSSTAAETVTPHSSAVPALLEAARVMDDARLRGELATHATSHGVEATVLEVVLPFLHAVGVGWERGEHTVATEHFASQVVRSWLHGEAVSGRPAAAAGRAPLVLACPPGERHDLGLLCFHVLLTRAGVPSRFLGSDTPLPGLAEVCHVLGASGVIVAGTRRRVFEARGGALRVLARRHPLAIGGAGADADVAERVHAQLLPADMGEAVRRVVDWHAQVVTAA